MLKIPFLLVESKLTLNNEQPYCRTMIYNFRTFIDGVSLVISYSIPYKRHNCKAIQSTS